MNKKIKQFLKESNAIEGVYDKDSLQQAIYAWEYIIKQKKLTVDNILKTHWKLMKNQDLSPDEKGFFRRSAVYIGAKPAMNNNKIAKAIEEWIYEMNVLMYPEHMDMERTSKGFHVEYETIHPFVDGNGRTGRIFMNWWRIKNKLPVLIIEESKKQEYYKWFK